MEEMEVFIEDYEQISELSDLHDVSDAQIVYALLEIVKRKKLIDKIKDYV